MGEINKLIFENFKFFNGEEEFNFEGKNVPSFTSKDKDLLGAICEFYQKSEGLSNCSKYLNQTIR